MTRVCHFTSVHKANDVRIFEKECSTLAAAGFDVTLVSVKTDFNHGHKITHIELVPEKPGRLYRMRKFSKEIYKAAAKVNAEIYHFHDPELLPYGKKLVKAGKKVIYDIHEDLPRALLSKPYLSKTVSRILAGMVERYENRIAKKLTALICATDHIKERFLKINKNTHSIYNYPLTENLVLPDTEKEPNSVCYIGGITQIRGLYQLFDAIEKTDAKLLLAGSVESAQMQERIDKLVEKGKIEYFGVVSRKEVIKIMNRSNAGLLTFLPEPNHNYAQPNKLFEYMSAGIPVIASSFPLWKKIIADENCGVCVDPENADDIAKKINMIINDDKTAHHMGVNGFSAVTDKYNWVAEGQKLIHLYRAILENDRK